MRIIFMGTPEFAVEQLKAIIESGYNVVAVVTSPDKPSGRGQQIQQSDVKKFAVANNIKVLQPEKLKDPLFAEQLQSLNADLQVVVAFRMLPEVIWLMPKLGTFNLHASLLPQYRGAAPINWAIINGETQTGLTTFMLDKEIDTGNIIFQTTVDISNSDNAETLHDKLMHEGKGLVVKTIEAIKNGEIHTKPQKQLINNSLELKHAPKIFKENCKINWNDDVKKVYDFIRGLSPYPAAWSVFTDNNGKQLTFKVFETKLEYNDKKIELGNIFTDNKKYFKIACVNGFINIKSIQLEGKKRLNIEEFLRGYGNSNCTYSLI